MPEELSVYERALDKCQRDGRIVQAKSVGVTVVFGYADAPDCLGVVRVDNEGNAQWLASTVNAMLKYARMKRNGESRSVW